MEALHKSAPYTAIVILLIVSIGVYLNTLPNEFVYDDEGQVLKNLWIRDAKYIPEIFLSNAWASEGKGQHSNYYRPIMNIIYMIDYHIFGLKPWGFHLTNILFHGGVSVLLFFILSMLIDQSQDLNSKSQIPNLKSQNLNLKSKISNLKRSVHCCPAFCCPSHPHRSCDMDRRNTRAIIYTILSTFFLSISKELNKIT